MFVQKPKGIKQVLMDLEKSDREEHQINEAPIPYS
jgi:hypothetical protein